MAKEVKAIKCPQCGSTAKKEIKEGIYRCDSCQTEYFLDDDDITINYNHHYTHTNIPDTDKKQDHALIKVIGIIAFAALAIFAISMVIAKIPRNDFRKTTTNRNDPAAVSTSPDQPEYKSSIHQPFVFTRTDPVSPVILTRLETRSYRAQKDESRDGVYFVFYDPIKNRLLHEQKIGDKELEARKFETRTFSDGSIYMLSPDNVLYLVDSPTLTLIEIDEKFFNTQPKLRVGVATINFVQETKGDGLILVTNDGKKFYYYPLVHQLYTEDDYYTAQVGFNTLLPRARERSYHAFTRESSDYPGTKIQLLRITYQDNGGGPKIVENRLRWRKDYGRSGIITGADPYTKVLVSDYDKQTGRITSWKDVTPERLYFSPAVMLEDEDKLIIKFRPDANSKSAFKLQQLNAKTGAIEWTAPMPGKNDIKSLVTCKEGFAALVNDNEIFILDKTGIVKDNYKIQ